MEKKKFFSAKNIAYLGILLALVIVLQFFASAIPMGSGVQLNLSLIPIVLGAIMFGMAGGAFLGLACGIVVLIQVVMGGGFYEVIWTGSPVITSFTCLLKTTVAGLVAGLLYKLIAKKIPLVGVFVAAGIVPIINTTIFILGCLCMSNTITVFRDILVNDLDMAKFSGMNVFVFILVGIVTFNFFIEFAINMVLAPAIHRVVLVVEKQIKDKKKKPVPEQAEPVSDGAEPLPEDDKTEEPEKEEQKETESEEKTGL